jgi:hypothetical protein
MTYLMTIEKENLGQKRQGLYPYTYLPMLPLYLRFLYSHVHPIT